MDKNVPEKTSSSRESISISNISEELLVTILIFIGSLLLYFFKLVGVTDH